MAEKKAEKVYTSIVDAFLDDREPEWKDLGLDDAKDSGEEQFDRTHQYVDTDFTDDIAESASRHTPVWPAGKAGSAEKQAQKSRLDAARKGSAIMSRDDDNILSGVSGISGARANWRNHAASEAHGKDFDSSVGDDQSLFAEVTMSMEEAAREGNLKENTADKKEVTDAAVKRYIHDLLNQGESPAKVAKKLEKLAEIELFNHQMATRYLQDNAGLIGMAYLEPNTYMDKQSPTYKHNASNKKADDAALTKLDAEINALSRQKEQLAAAGKDKIKGGEYDAILNQLRQKNQERMKFYSVRSMASGDSNECVAQYKRWQRAGVKPKAASVKQISACEGCQYFSKQAGQKNCGLYHLPVVANTKELSPVINKLTPGVPVKQKRAALVQIANGNDGTKVNLTPRAPTKTASGLSAPVVGTVDAQAKRAARVAPLNWDSSHVAKLHAAGHSLKAITVAAEKKFGTFPAAKALSSFVATLKPNVNGQIVIAKADAVFLKERGVHGKGIVGAAKCASCDSHITAAAQKRANLSPLSRVPQNYVESNPDMLRTARVKDNPVMDASVIEHYHKKGHPLEKIYKSAASKFGSAQAAKAVKEFIASLKNKPIKVALSQINCTFLKQKLAVHNPIVGAAKCGTCTYRKGMHCGLTGGTLLSFPGMDKQVPNHTVMAGAPEDGRSILNEFELTASTARPGDTKMADIEYSSDYGDVGIGNTASLGEV